MLNQLYKHTQLESTFGIIMLAIENNQPRLFNLKELLTSFIDFRKKVVTRRTRFELNKAKERAHILEGLLIALDRIDEVITLIRSAHDPKEAAEKLIALFGLTEIQAKSILDMRLQRLTGLERAKVEEEYQALTLEIEKLSAILADPARILDVIVEELREIKERYGDERRTEISDEMLDIAMEDLVAEEDVIVTVSHAGYIKRIPVGVYRSQRRGGRGKMGMVTKDEDFVTSVFVASTHQYILIFTDRGRVYWLKVYQIPEAGRTAKGKALVNLVNFNPNERLRAILPVREFSPDRYVVMVTKYGIVKKTSLAVYANPRTAGIIALSIDEGDTLVDVQETDGTADIFLATRFGKAIRFPETEVREMGRAARGVRGMHLEPGDSVVGAEILHAGNSILTVTERGYGKRTPIEEYRRQSRGGKGIINLRTTQRVGLVSGICQVTGGEDVILISDTGNIIRLSVDEIPLTHRSTQGVRLIDLSDNERLTGMTRLAKDEEEGGDDPSSTGSMVSPS